ncbi:MAG: hypothetical protein P8Z68_11330 [Kineosporiaceae bacterium]|jgi:hypothetical protein
MGWFGRRKAAAAQRQEHRQQLSDAQRHLQDFVRSRTGVEAFIEPATSVTPPTVLLIAATGEWTRRRIGDRSTLDALAQDLHVPLYDVQLVGYPQRMRDWNARAKREGRTTGLA